MSSNVNNTRNPSASPPSANQDNRIQQKVEEMLNIEKKKNPALTTEQENEICKIIYEREFA